MIKPMSCILICIFLFLIFIVVTLPYSGLDVVLNSLQLQDQATKDLAFKCLSFGRNIVISMSIIGLGLSASILIASIRAETKFQNTDE